MSAEPHQPAAGPTPELPPGYSPFPTHPPPPLPQHVRARNDGRATASLLSGVIGLVLSVVGIPGMVLGPLAYFLGKSSVHRIDESKGEMGGRSTAVAGWVLGVIATAIGSLATLVYFVLLLIAISGQPAQ